MDITCKYHTGQLACFTAPKAEAQEITFVHRSTRFPTHKESYQSLRIPTPVGYHKTGWPFQNSYRNAGTVLGPGKQKTILSLIKKNTKKHQVIPKAHLKNPRITQWPKVHLNGHKADSDQKG